MLFLHVCFRNFVKFKYHNILVEVNSRSYRTQSSRFDICPHKEHTIQIKT
jgi:hypothetical protein